MRYSDPTPSIGWTYYGGRINAYKALSSLLTPGMLTVSETASPSSETQISVAWTDNATGEDGYKIERKTGAGSYILLYTLPPDTTSYNDTYDLVPGTTYTYRVKAFNTLPAESFYSNAEPITVSGTPEPRHHGGGGGGCSIGARQGVPTAIADLAVLLIPVIVIAIIRRQRR